MTVSSVGGAAADIAMDYMKLLVTQLQNQNPLEPMDNNQMATQLAQLSSLEQLETMSSTFEEVLASQQRMQATELIGKEIDFVPEGQTDLVSGRVSGVQIYDTGVRVQVGDYLVDVNEVQAVRD